MGGFLARKAGWGIVQGDDQMLANIFAAQKLVRPNTNASKALEEVHKLGCDKQQKDTQGDIFKTMADIMINVGVAYATGGMNWMASYLAEVRKQFPRQHALY